MAFAEAHHEAARRRQQVDYRRQRRRHPPPAEVGSHLAEVGRLQREVQLGAVEPGGLSEQSTQVELRLQPRKSARERLALHNVLQHLGAHLGMLQLEHAPLAVDERAAVHLGDRGDRHRCRLHGGDQRHLLAAQLGEQSGDNL